MIRLSLCAMLASAGAAGASGMKRDLQGVALGMTPAQAKAGTRRACTDMGRAFLCVDAQTVGHTGVDDTQMEIRFTRNLTPATAYWVALEFCSGADLGSVTKETRESFGYAGEARATTRGPTSLRFDPDTGTTVLVESHGACLDHAGQTRYRISLIDDALSTADHSGDPDAPAPGKATPRL